MAEVLNQLNQAPNQRALLRNQRSIMNPSTSSSINSSTPSTGTNSVSTSSALSLLHAAAAVATAATVANGGNRHYMTGKIDSSSLPFFYQYIKKFIKIRKYHHRLLALWLISLHRAAIHWLVC